MQKIITLLLLTLTLAFADIQLTPDGTYVNGEPQLTPDGTYVGSGDIQLAPDGTYIATEPEDYSYSYPDYSANPYTDTYE